MASRGSQSWSKQDQPPEEPLQGLGLVGFPPLSTHLPAQGLTFPYTSTSKRMPKALRRVRYSLPFSIL